jgi:hypothetical protein
MHMLQLRFISGALLFAGLLAGPAWAAPAPTDKGALDQVPASAVLVVHLHGVEGVLDRLEALVRPVAPNQADKLREHADKLFKEGYEGRKLRGLAKEGPIFAAFTEMPKPGTEPVVAIIAAITSYTEFRDNAFTEDERKTLKKEEGEFESIVTGGNTVYLVDRKGYVVASPSKDLAKSFTKKYDGLSGKISTSQAAKLLASDLGAYVSMDAFNKEYADQIKQARETIEALLKFAAGAAEKSQQAQIEMVQKAIGPLFQAVEDSQGLLASFEFRPNGVAFHLQSELRAGSATNRTLKDFQISSFQDMAQLPDGQMLYMGIENNSALMKLLGPMIVGAVAEPGSDEAKKIEAAVAKMIKARPGARLDAYAIPVSGIQVWSFKDPAKAIEAQLELIRAMGAGNTLQSGMLKEKPVIKMRAEKYGDFEFHSIKVVWDLDKMVEDSGKNLPDEAKKKMKEMFQKMIGEGAQVYLGTDGKSMVQLTGKDWATARKALQSYFGKDGEVRTEPNFAAVRKELPAEGTVIVLFDTIRYARAILEIMGPSLGGMVPLPQPPAVPAKGKASYFGGAVSAQAERAGFDLFVSVAAVKDVYTNIVAPLLGGR